MDNVLTITVHGGRANLAVNEGTTTLTIAGTGVRVEISVADANGFSIPAQPTAAGTVALPQATKAVSKAVAKAAATTPKETTVWRWPANVKRPTTKELRKWAVANKLKVGAVGIISRQVQEAYVQDHAK